MTSEILKRAVVGASLACLAATPALAADISNGDAVRQTIGIMEAGHTARHTLDPGEHIDVCPNGCIVEFPDGGQIALSGAEMVEIRGGVGHLD